MSQEPYNANGELLDMKRDIADRSYKLTVKKFFFTAVGLIAGALLLPAVLPILGLGAITGIMPVIMGGALGAMAGGAVGEFLTMKERTKLKIDEDMTQSYMSGKNYWGEGYRKEVAEYGYGLSAPTIPNERSRSQERG